jgi:hypothetical protein
MYYTIDYVGYVPYGMNVFILHTGQISWRHSAVDQRFSASRGYGGTMLAARV